MEEHNIKPVAFAPTSYNPEACQCCKDPIYDDHREFEVDGKPACLKCWVEAINVEALR